MWWPCGVSKSSATISHIAGSVVARQACQRMGDRILIFSGFSPPTSVQCPAPSVKVEPLIERSIPTSADNPVSSSPEMEPKLARLWSVYKKARADFEAVSKKADSVKRAVAAKFLRDTAENTIQYLQNKNTDPIMMAELFATYNMAKSTAVSLAGGKKRKFDYVEMDMVKGTPRGPSSVGSKTRHEGASKSVSDRYKKRELIGPPGYTGEYVRDRAKSNNRGRGHSSVPFGYSRTVDSYQPHQGLEEHE